MTKKKEKKRKENDQNYMDGMFNSEQKKHKLNKSEIKPKIQSRQEPRDTNSV